MSDLTLTDVNDFSALQEAMGMSQDLETKAKSSTLARLKILHEGVKGETVIKGKKTEYTAIDAGVYELTLSNGAKLYQKNPKVRLFLQRFMYQRYILNDNRYVKTTLATDLKSNLPDMDGGFNCGRQAGYVEDYASLPQEQKDVDRVRTILGEVYFDKALDESGEELDCSKSTGIPFVADFKKEAFKIFEPVIKEIATSKLLPPQCILEFNTDAKAGKSGLTYYIPKVSITKKDVSMTEADQKTFRDFVAWADSFNQNVMEQHNKNTDTVVASKIEEVEEPVVIEPKKKETKKVTHNSDGSPKSGKDLESVMNAWTEDD